MNKDALEFWNRAYTATLTGGRTAAEARAVADKAMVDFDRNRVREPYDKGYEAKQAEVSNPDAVEPLP